MDNEGGADMATACVTGATAGIGRAFAFALAARGLDLVLVARDGERLSSVAGEIRDRFAVTADVLAADLSDPTQRRVVEDRLSDRSHPVSVLVNNAGFGLRTPFLRTDVEDEQRSIDVLVTAVMRLTHAVLPGMVERNFGIVFNISSVAGWITGGTYSAAKAWVTVFSESLAAEFAGSGVRVVAVCPGFTRTEFHERAGIDMSEVPSWLWLDADAVVARALRDAAIGQPLSVAGPVYQALSTALRMMPRSLVRRAGRFRRSSARFGRREAD